MEGGIAVIDLENFPVEYPKLLEAGKEWGCFRIVNHKIPANLLLEMKSVVRSLLDLPTEIKRRNIDVIPGSGYVAPSEGNPLYEALGLYDIGSEEAVHTFCDQLEASPHQRDIIKSYSHALHELVMDIGGKLAESMGLGCDLVKGWTCQFRINKYNFTEETVGTSGVCIHTDSSFLTILQEDHCVGGLEVMNKSGSFVPIDPLQGTLLVNLGDMATIWSNGMFRNVKHRVQCKEAVTRVSIALFLLGPKEDAVVAPQEFVDTDHPRLFIPITHEDFRKLRLSSGSRAGEALELLRLTTSS